MRERARVQHALRHADSLRSALAKNALLKLDDLLRTKRMKIVSLFHDRRYNVNGDDELDVDEVGHLCAASIKSVVGKGAYGLVCAAEDDPSTWSAADKQVLLDEVGDMLAEQGGAGGRPRGDLLVGAEYLSRVHLLDLRHESPAGQVRGRHPRLAQAGGA